MAYATVPPTPFSELTPIMAYNLLLIGLSNIFWVPVANTFGRRIVFIVGALTMTLSSLWAAKASSLPSLLGARSVQAVGMGPSFTLPATVISEVFFLHQAGRAIAVYTAALAAGPVLGGITGGYIASNAGVTAIWWISTGLSGGALCLILFLLPETMFDRTHYLRAEDSAPYSLATASGNKPEIQQDEGNIPVEENIAMGLTLWQAIRAGVYRPGFPRELVKPICTVPMPGVWVATLQVGSMVAGVVTMATAGPQLLAVPPYSWGANVGLFNLGALVGMLMALLCNYTIVDLLVRRRATQHADGLVEAESRLPLSGPGLFLATAGLLTFGFCAEHPGGSAWAGLVVGNGMLTFGLVLVPGIVYAYIVDSYRPVAGDCFVVVGIVRSIISCVWTLYVVDWMHSIGPALIFGVFAIVLGVFSLLTVPLFVYGKRFRIATAKYF
ncbi:major facilitator superfamily domain-containing protein [Aspergillus carlsbadensis]|nr:major facilitator superfamily domain-containing protein [Aspergillus carlsbadensis]